MPKTAAFTDPVSGWEIHYNIIANFLFIAFFHVSIILYIWYMLPN